MLKGIKNRVLYGVDSVVSSFKNECTDERIIFSLATTFSEFKGQSRQGISRRGVVIFTEQRVFFKSVLLSLYSLVYILGALICFWSFFRTQNFYALIAGIIVGAMIIQRLPLQRNLSLEDIKEAELVSVPGSLFSGGKGSYRLKIVTDKGITFFSLAETLPDEVKGKLGIAKEHNLPSQKTP